MSEQKHYYTGIGVFKVDYKAAGYADLVRIAKEWSEDPNFYELIVRGVSEKNFGIQFIYYLESEDKLEDNPMKGYKKKLMDIYGKDFYAWDFHNHHSTDKSEIFHSIIVSKALKEEE